MNKKKQIILQNEILSSEVGFWDDQKKARTIMQELENLRDEVEHFEVLLTTVEDLIGLGAIANTEEEWKQIETQTIALQKAVKKLEFQTFFDGEYDGHDAIVTIQTGAGGIDAQDWSDMLLRMYMKWAESHSFTVKVLDKVNGAEAGIKSATIEIIGRWAYGYMRAELGIHRLVRLSPFNSDKLRQTSFARVDVMPVIEEVKEMKCDMEDLRIDTFRASGAGGQHVNTTDSAVRVTHIPSGITAQCQSERSQAQNKEYAIKLVKAKLHKEFLIQQDKKKKELRGEVKDAQWGNQIRSYVLHPYKMVKDHRTKYETANVEDVLEGNIDAFMMAFLRMK